MILPLPTLTLVVPVGPGDDARLHEFLASLEGQTYPKVLLEIRLVREGNSEEAKAIGIQRAKGAIIGLFCADNVLVGPRFLEDLTRRAAAPGVTGAYPARYAYVRGDPALNRYFALLGANDPLCWWLGKADRRSYLDAGWTGVHQSVFQGHIPSLGDNGFFIKAALIKSVTQDPTQHFCIDACEDLRRQGHATYVVDGRHVLWHRTGLSLWRYLGKRWRYTRELYWRDHAKRRWHMVAGRRDWLHVVQFAAASLCVLPQLWVSVRGYRRLSDPAWFLHPVVCLALTLLYAGAWIAHLSRRSLRWLFAAIVGQTPWRRA